MTRVERADQPLPGMPEPEGRNRRERDKEWLIGILDTLGEVPMSLAEVEDIADRHPMSSVRARAEVIASKMAADPDFAITSHRFWSWVSV